MVSAEIRENELGFQLNTQAYSSHETLRRPVNLREDNEDANDLTTARKRIEMQISTSGFKINITYIAFESVAKYRW